MKILVTGANGYVGKSLVKALSDKYEVTAASRTVFDLADREATNVFFKDKYYDVILHTAVSGGHRTRRDTFEVMDNNLQMYYNLLVNREHFGKFINFCSGAEEHARDTPYGLSKHVVRQSLFEKENCYNLKVYAVFDENELDTRFIKASIKHYIDKEPIVIHQDKFMDFIYMKDLVKIVEHYINGNGPKEVDCNYDRIMSLFDIAKIINSLDEHRVNIQVESKERGKPYTGGFQDLDIKFIGLEQGIREVYTKLK